MKNVLAKNLLRFRAKNLSESNVSNLHKTDLQEIAPTGGTISAEAQQQIDKLISDSANLLQNSRNLTFTSIGGTFKGQIFQTTKIGIKRGKMESDIYWYLEVKRQGATEPYVTNIYFTASKDNKTPLITANLKIPGIPITGQNVQELAVKNGSTPIIWQNLDYQTNKSSWDTIAAALVNIGNKYIATGVGNPEQY